jgi:hypothetical protein
MSVDQGRTKVAADMPVIDVLAAKDDILENWAAFAFLISGDGVTDGRAQWADHTFTSDVKWKWYDATGNLRMEANGIDEMRLPPMGAAHSSFAQVPMTIKYDEITPTTAKTRTVVMYVNVPKSTLKGQPDGVPGFSRGVPQVALGVYHDTWRKENGRWKKSESILYDANGWPADFMPIMGPRP